MRQYWAVPALIAAFSIFIALSPGPQELSVSAPMPGPSGEKTATPDMPPMPDRLAPPPTEYPPSQASEGAQVYYLVCMACHGDKGQGLTNEWRGALDPADQNCWQSHCHAANHPPEGFVLPKFVPAVIGPGVLDGYSTALDLHNFIQAKMPWQAPGSLPADQYWQLTAYLLRQNGVGLGHSPLDEQNAAELQLHTLPSSTPTPTPEALPGLTWTSAIPWIGLFGLFVVGGLILVVILIRR
jgi:mono/diheme cytochrome c family protein